MWHMEQQHWHTGGAIHLAFSKTAIDQLAIPALNTGRTTEPRQGIAAPTFYEQIKVFFAVCGDVLRVERCEGCRAVCEGQHALDAAFARQSCIEGGMPFEIAQQNLEYSSLSTTTAYVTTEKRRRMRAVETFWNR